MSTERNLGSLPMAFVTDDGTRVIKSVSGKEVRYPESQEKADCLWKDYGPLNVADQDVANLKRSRRFVALCRRNRSKILHLSSIDESVFDALVSRLDRAGREWFFVSRKSKPLQSGIDHRDAQKTLITAIFPDSNDIKRLLDILRLDRHQLQALANENCRRFGPDEQPNLDRDACSDYVDGKYVERDPFEKAEAAAIFDGQIEAGLCCESGCWVSLAAALLLEYIWAVCDQYHTLQRWYYTGPGADSNSDHDAVVQAKAHFDKKMALGEVQVLTWTAFAEVIAKDYPRLSTLDRNGPEGFRGIHTHDDCDSLDCCNHAIYTLSTGRAMNDLALRLAIVTRAAAIEQNLTPRDMLALQAMAYHDTSVPSWKHRDRVTTLDPIRMFLHLIGLMPQDMIMVTPVGHDVRFYDGPAEAGAADKPLSSYFDSSPEYNLAKFKAINRFARHYRELAKEQLAAMSDSEWSEI